MTRTRWIVLSVLAVIAIVAITWGIFALVDALERVSVRTLPVGVSTAELVEEKGIVSNRLRLLNGEVEHVSPQAYADRLYREAQDESLGYRILVKVFNISSAATAGWVVLGLLGQAIFASRMIVQWIVSERQRQSVVPTAFWWLALCGASMLLIYFIWRKDIVGILGQCTGWLIYSRNLYFIYLKKPKATDEPIAEPA